MLKKYKDIIKLFFNVCISLTIFYILSFFIKLQYPIVKLFNYFKLVDSFGVANINNNIIIIDSQCSGFFSIFVFITVILSPLTNLNKKQKLIYCILGSLILYLTNILRLSIFFIFPNYFDLVHFLGWILMSFLILILWYIANKTKRIIPNQHNSL